MGYVYDGGSASNSVRSRTYKLENLKYDDSSLFSIEEGDLIDEEEIKEDNLLDNNEEEKVEDILDEGFSYSIKDMGSVASVDYKNTYTTIRIPNEVLDSDNKVKVEKDINSISDLFDEVEPDDTILEDVEINIVEEYLTSKYGIDRINLFPLETRKDVLHAIKNFNKISNEQDRVSVSKKLINKLEILNSDVLIEPSNKLYSYVPDKYKKKSLYENTSILDKDSLNIVANNDYVPYYVILTASNSPFAKTIRGYTGDDFSHASISFNHEMNKLYSFNVEGFVIESFDRNKRKEIIRLNDNTNYIIYVSFMKKTTIDKVKEYLDNMNNNKDKTHYNTIGILKYITKIPSKTKQYTQFCSEFVTNVIKIINEEIIESKSSLTSPEGIIKNSKTFELLESGVIKDFEPDVLKDKVLQLIRNNRFKKFLSENSLFFNNMIYNKDFSEYIKYIKNYDVFNYFYPCTKLGELTTSLCIGGVYNETDKSDANLMGAYDTMKNYYGVGTYKDNNVDIKHLKYCIKLYDIFNGIIKGNIKSLNDIEENNRWVIMDWRLLIEEYLELYNKCSDENSKLIYKQYLHDLLWDTSFINDMVINGNIHGMFRLMKKLNLINESVEGVLNKEDLYAYIKNKSLLSSEHYLLPVTFEYPIFDEISIRMAMDIIHYIDPEYVEEYTKNLLRKYKEFNCTFRLPINHPFYRYPNTEYIVPSDIISLNLPELVDNDTSKYSTVIPDIDIILSELKESIENL